MAHKLKSLDSEFHTHHYKILNLIDDSDKDSPAREQSILDSHDNEVTSLKAVWKLFINLCSCSSPFTIDSNLCKLTTWKLAQLEKGVTTILESIDSPPTPVDPCRLRQHEEQLHDIKYELGWISDDILTIDLNDSHDLPVLQAKTWGHFRLWPQAQVVDCVTLCACYHPCCIHCQQMCQTA